MQHGHGCERIGPLRQTSMPPSQSVASRGVRAPFSLDKLETANSIILNRPFKRLQMAITGFSTVRNRALVVEGHTSAFAFFTAELQQADLQSECSPGKGRRKGEICGAAQSLEKIYKFGARGRNRTTDTRIFRKSFNLFNLLRSASDCPQAHEMLAHRLPIVRHSVSC